MAPTAEAAEDGHGRFGLEQNDSGENEIAEAQGAPEFDGFGLCAGVGSHSDP